MTDELTYAIKDNAKGPKRDQSDTGSVEQHALMNQIEADQNLASKKGVVLRMKR